MLTVVALTLWSEIGFILLMWAVDFRLHIRKPFEPG
jgi:hypothetical protein